MIAVIRAKDLIVPYRKRRLAAIRAVPADRAEILHLPRPRLVAVSPAGQRAYGADVNAHATFFAGKLAIVVRDDDGMYSARAHAERLDVHSFVADTHAAEAQDAARRVIINDRRPFLFGIVQLFLDEPAVVHAVSECHVLQFTLAALVADRAIEWMVREDVFEHVLPRFMHRGRVGEDHHALFRNQRASRSQFLLFLDFYQAH